MEHGSEEDESSGRNGSASLVGASLETGRFGRDHELVGTIEEDRAFHAPSLRVSLDRIVEEKDYYGQRFRKEKGFRPTTDPPAPTSFAASRDLTALATQNLPGVMISQFATPEGVVEFTRMMTMVESVVVTASYPPRISCTTRASRRGSLERNWEISNSDIGPG